MFGETTIFHVKIWNHPIETTIYKWLFGVPGESLMHEFYKLGTSFPFKATDPVGHKVLLRKKRRDGYKYKGNPFQNNVKLDVGEK